MARSIAVIGGGVVGLLTAIMAGEAGLEPVILDPGGRDGASWGNAGVLHLIQPPPGRLRKRLAPEGARMWRRILPSLGLEPLETCLVIASRLPHPLLEPLARLIRRLYPWTRPRAASAGEARRLEPLLGPGIRGAIIVPGYGVVEPRRLMEALWRRALETATHIRGEAARIECTGSGARVTLSDGSTLSAWAAVNASGLGAHVLARLHGIRVTQRPGPGVMELYRDPRPTCIVARLPTSSRTKGGAIIPWPQGTLYGPTLHKPGEQPPPPGGVALRYKGLLSEEPRGLIERITGVRAIARPRDFHIIRPPRCPRTVHLLGIESPGLTAAPALASRALSLLGVKLKYPGPGRAS